jgi:hypothetical protein
VYVTEQEAVAAGPARAQLVWVASDGRPVNVTVPVIGWLSPLSADVTVAVQVVDPPFQSMLDGVQVTVAAVGVLITRLPMPELESCLESPR